MRFSKRKREQSEAADREIHKYLYNDPVVDYEQYRASESERARTADLLALIDGGHSALDIGARDGHFSRPLAERFDRVTALDLTRPAWQHPGIDTVAGNVTRLEFADNSFDLAFCAEVLEHVPEIEAVCAEIARVTRRYCVIGVPFQQDTRTGRTSCRACGRTSPPWGHVNTFTLGRLRSLFPKIEIDATSFVGESEDATNSISAWLMDAADNPYGTYGRRSRAFTAEHNW